MPGTGPSAFSFDLYPRHAVFSLEGEVGSTEVAELHRGEAKTAPGPDARPLALKAQVEGRIMFNEKQSW